MSEDLPPVAKAPDSSKHQIFVSADKAFNSGVRTSDILSTLSSIAEDCSFPAIYRGQSLFNLASFAFEKGAIEEAEICLNKAVKLGELAGRLDLQMEGLYLKATCAAKENQWPKVCELTGEAIRRIELARNKINAPYAATSFMADKYKVYLLGINAARLDDNPSLMLNRMECLKAREMTTQIADSGIPLEKAFEEISTLMDSSLNGKLPLAERQCAIEKRRLIWEECQLLRAEPAMDFELHRLQGLLSNMTVVLSYFFLTEKTLLITAITQQETKNYCIPLDDDGLFFDALDHFSSASVLTPGLDYALTDLAAKIIAQVA